MRPRCAYFAAGMALLTKTTGTSQYELTFNLRLECAECEILTGNSTKPSN